MFSHWLGDCFLLTFYVGGDERHKLLNRLRHAWQKTTSVKIHDVAEHVLATIGNRQAACRDRHA